MENINIKRLKGRPKFEPKIEELKELFKQVENKTMTNEEAWKLAKCHKTKWYELKKKFKLEANIKC